MAAVAASVAKLLEGENQNSISIGQFTGPPSFPSSASSAFTQFLSEEFKKLGIQVKTTAPFGIKGEYLLAEATDPGNRLSKQLVVQVKGSVVDRLGKVITDFTFGDVAQGEFKRLLKDEQSLVHLVGLTSDMTAAPGLEDRRRRLLDAVTKPQGHVRESRIAASPTAPYSIEILVEGKPIAVELKDGLPFVDVQRGQSYEIRLNNESDLDAAVNLTIDGLSTFAFSEMVHSAGPHRGEPLFNLWIVPKRSSVLVRGWHRTNERVDSFLVTEYSRSAAASLSHVSNLGSITASFMAAWPAGQSPPRDEPPTQKGVGSATGFGATVDQRSKPVERKTGVIRSVITVRYTRENHQ